MIEYQVKLIIDIGNTRTKYAIFDWNKMVAVFVTEKMSFKSWEKVFKTYPIEACILSNSGKVSGKVIQFFLEASKFIHLSSQTPLPIEIDYDTPKTLGSDRIAGSVGATKYFSQQNCLIISLGTCITMDFVEKGKIFRGGNISPGLNMRLNAMHDYTARLPRAELDVPNNILGESTNSALQNGGVVGAFLEIEKFIEILTCKYGNINVLVTGGDAEYFEKYTKKVIFAAPNLVFEGLNEILNYNARI